MVDIPAQSTKIWQQVRPHLRWTRSSSLLLGTFFLTCALIVGIWWNLAAELLALIPWDGEWWLYMDWLLLGIFAFMSALLVIGADVRKDALIIFVGLCGGLVIESWGTQTELWTYYTNERPPLWIIPAWPIASLAIDRLVRLLRVIIPERQRIFDVLYLAVFSMFAILLIGFVLPTLDKPMTIGALILCAFLIMIPENKRVAVLTFAAGSGLGYFLELWGTTRLCWVYYTGEQPPLFAVLAHGMAAVAFWRAAVVLQNFYVKAPVFRHVDALIARIPLGD